MVTIAGSTHLIPQCNLPIIPPRCSSREQLFHVSKEQDFIDSVRLVAGFLGRENTLQE